MINLVRYIRNTGTELAQVIGPSIINGLTSTLPVEFWIVSLPSESLEPLTIESHHYSVCWLSLLHSCFDVQEGNIRMLHLINGPEGQ